VIPVLDMFVPGLARPQGSMRAVQRHGRVQTFHANKDELLAWRGAVTAHAADLWGDEAPLDEAVTLSCDFWLPRPPSVKRRLHPDRAPDLDKLVRAVGDALTGIVFTDDARIVRTYAAKHYSDEHLIGARIICGSANVLGPSKREWETAPASPATDSPAAGAETTS
jgi:crossover junction endodeoxyribonuclease RusA